MPRNHEPDDLFDLPGRVVGGGGQRARLEDAVTQLVNDHRRKAGLRPLRANERLRAAARQHSEAMARRGFFSHVDPDGFSAFDRMLLAGYESPGAENIARGQDRPESVLHGWLNSAGHRANILNGEFRTIGVGVYLAAGGPWWTQNFGY